jgi:hypothetical protein
MAASTDVDVILEIVGKVEQDSIGLVQAADLIENEFRKRGELYDMQMHSRQVGFDPTNRDSTGGNAQEVFLLATDIAFVGFSWAETAHALCVETKPGDRSVEQFNRRLSDGTGLAPVLEDSIHFGSLSCGHTNMALRCIDAAVASECPLLSQDGRLSVQKLQSRDPVYAEAVRQGLKWRVLRWGIRDKYPQVLGLLQAARNVSGHVQRKIHEVQGLLQMHGLASTMQKNGQPVEWTTIKRAVLRSKPPFAESIDHLMSFLATRSGGLSGA